MPMSRVGTGPVAHGVGEGGRQPGAQVAVDLRDDVASRRGPARRAARRGRPPGGPPASRAPRRGCRRRPPRRSRRPARGCTAGSSRVLLRPGTGALVITSSWVSAHRASTALMSRTVRTVPQHRAGHLRPAARGARAVVDVDLEHPPAGVGRPGDHLQRVAEAAVGEPRAPAASARRAARIGPRSCSRSPVRRRSSRASATLATRACSGHAPRAVGRRRPSTRSASRRAPGRPGAGSCAGSIEPSASQKQTTSAVAASQPGVGGGAEAALRRRGRRSRRARRRPRAEPSVEPLSATIAR